MASTKPRRPGRSFSPERFTHELTGVLLLLVVLTAGGCNSERIVLVEPAIWASESSIFLDPGEARTLSVATTPPNSPFDAVGDPVAAVTKSSSAITITGLCVGFGTVFLNLTDHPGIDFEITVEVEGEVGQCVESPAS